VIAYAPTERRQTLDAPIGGRVVQWLVREGSYVEKGEPMVEIRDNDPDLLTRLETQKDAAGTKLESYETRLMSLQLQIDAARASLRSEVASAEAKLRVAGEKLKSQKQKLAATEAALETAMLNLGRVRALSTQGLAATRDLELAELAATKARTERDGTQADVLAAVGDLDAARAGLDKARAEGAAKISEAEAKLQSGQSDAADARGSLTSIQVSLARQAQQIVRAPRAGVVLQILTAEDGEQIKQGDPLAVIVPSTEDRATEIWIDGNDASLVSEGRKVRLQFEGWPAVQFSGWPSVAVGTFGGTVAFVDPHDDGKGNFRAVVLPDPDDEPWPTARFLRQGVQVKGWILLEQVSVGFELWRRFNGFPPMLEAPPGHESPTGKKP
jgi:multidrug resistance efflux pump